MNTEDKREVSMKHTKDKNIKKQKIAVQKIKNKNINKQKMTVVNFRVLKHKKHTLQCPISLEHKH